ncbi:MAG TPA: hypothetical protein VEL74_06050, partial [Thermoanaerobaculia bacterium]|nr:hypothetical protein [Thermoanaerobaculia bacterium]
MDDAFPPIDSPILSEATSQALEFPGLLALVAQLAASDLGRERALSLRPFAEEEGLRTHRRRFEEVSRLLADGPVAPSFDVPVGALL